MALLFYCITITIAVGAVLLQAGTLQDSNLPFEIDHRCCEGHCQPDETKPEGCLCDPDCLSHGDCCEGYYAICLGPDLCCGECSCGNQRISNKTQRSEYIDSGELGNLKEERAFPVECLERINTISEAFQRNFITSFHLAMSSKRAISTYHFDVPNTPLQNGEIAHFNFQRLKSECSCDIPYVLVPLPTDTASNVAAYYLGTTLTITIPAFPPGTSERVFSGLVVTPPLQGCSIYVKYNNPGDLTGRTLTIFHHLRPFTGFGSDRCGGREICQLSDGTFKVWNPETETDEFYDDVLCWEEYVRETTQLPVYPSTAMLYFDPRGTGRWSFANQMISRDFDPNVGVRNFKWEAYNQRYIYNVPDHSGVVIETPPGRCPPRNPPTTTTPPPNG